jgi:hypothetical protein
VFDVKTFENPFIRRNWRWPKLLLWGGFVYIRSAPEDRDVRTVRQTGVEDTEPGRCFFFLHQPQLGKIKIRKKSGRNVLLDTRGGPTTYPPS